MFNGLKDKHHPFILLKSFNPDSNSLDNPTPECYPDSLFFTKKGDSVMHDTHQGSEVSEIIRKSFFTPPPVTILY